MCYVLFVCLHLLCYPSGFNHFCFSLKLCIPFYIPYFSAFIHQSSVPANSLSSYLLFVFFSSFCTLVAISHSFRTPPSIFLSLFLQLSFIFFFSHHFFKHSLPPLISPPLRVPSLAILLPLRTPLPRVSTSATRAIFNPTHFYRLLSPSVADSPPRLSVFLFARLLDINSFHPD